MKSRDLPQDATPARIRALLEAIEAGSRDRAEVAAATGLSRRHVAYHLTAAGFLGFLAESRDWFVTTSLGKEWLAAPERGSAERELFRRGLEESEDFRRLVPGFPDAPPPRSDVLAERIRLLTKCAAETAKRRADTLLRYADHALGRDVEPDLFTRREDAGAPPGDTAPAAPMGPAAPAAMQSGRPLRGLQVLRFGCFESAEARLGALSVVVGANASGKSTLFDVIGFVSDALEVGVPEAVGSRVTSLEQLLWLGEGESFALAIELSVPAALVAHGRTCARYEIEIGRQSPDGGVGVRHEALYLKDDAPATEVLHGDRRTGWRKVLSMFSAGNAWYGSENSSWKTTFHLGPAVLALSQLPSDEKRFPVALWARSVLREGVQRLELNGREMRRPCSPLRAGKFLPDGSNLPLVVRRLKSSNPKRFREWVAHIATALPDVRDVKVSERPEDKHAYLIVAYDGGLELPAWRVSDGTLRLLALTLLAYIDVKDAVYLIEEPENGIHPQALEVIFQALSSCYESQVIVATHSPVFLSIVPPERFLVLSKVGGRSTITSGDAHPVLRGWQRDADLGTLFASGVLT